MMARRAAEGLTITILVMVVGTWSPIAEAALPSSPFELSVSPSSPLAGQPATIHIAPTSGPTGPRDQLYDLYVVRLMTTRAPYLAPDATWSPEPTPFRRAVSPSDFARIDQPWRAAPVGWFSVALVTVGSGEPVASRASWRYRPSQRWVMVQPLRGAGDPSLTEQAGVLGILAILACLAAVWVFVDAARAERPEASSAPSPGPATPPPAEPGASSQGH